MNRCKPRRQVRRGDSVRRISLSIFPALLPLLLLVAETAASPTSAAEEGPPRPAPTHTPLYSVTAGKSVPVTVTFAHPAAIAEVRLYFKTMESTAYLFLPMPEAADKTFSASLPPARNWTRGLDYLILRKSLGGEIRRSRAYRLLIMDDFSTPPPAGSPIQVQAEDFAAAAQQDAFAVPLEITLTDEPLLAEAIEDPSPPVQVPGPQGGSSGIFDGLGGMRFSFKAGGISFHYGSFSGK